MPSGEKAADKIDSLWLNNLPTSLRVSSSMRTAFPFLKPARINLASGEMELKLVRYSKRFGRLSSLPVAASQSMGPKTEMVKMELASEEKTTDVTGESKYLNILTFSPVPLFHNVALPSCEPVTKYFPSGEKATEVISDPALKTLTSGISVVCSINFRAIV